VKAWVAGISPNAFRALAGGLILLYVLATWFLVVSPKRSDAAEARDELAAAEDRLAEARAAARRSVEHGVRVSDVLRLAKAMPSSEDQAGLVLELTRSADRSGVELRSITPASATLGAGGATMIPITVSVDGRFREITRFLSRVRALVAVRSGEVRAKGRLLNVQSVELTESTDSGFPELEGTIVLHAYVYDGPIAPPETPDTGDEEPSPTGETAAGRTD
jgi:Tfp pilus assembly protein PilO